MRALLRHPAAVFAVLAAGLVGLHLATSVPSEPFYEGDETRHVMTGVFVHDALRGGGFADPRRYAEDYYARYPSLGLLLWPPGFYAVEGVAMLAFGPTFETARGVMLAYFVLAAAYLFALARRTHGTPTAAVAILLFGLGREVYFHTRGVMLEVPATACALGAVFHLERYLAAGRRRDLLLVALWTVAAGLHRYDAVYLAAVFGLRLVFARRLALLRRRDVLLAGLGVVLVLAPVYWFSLSRIGSTSHALPRAWWRVVIDYPAVAWLSLGHAAAVAAAVGLYLSLGRPHSAPYWSLAGGAYLVLTALGETYIPRHAIPWLPALCVFAADAALSPRRPLYAACLTSGVVAATAAWTLYLPVPFVRGYRPAAEYVLAHTDGACVVLFDGLLDGTFVYGVRQEDFGRRAWVVRGDKLLYAVRSDPEVGYVEWAATEADVRKIVTNLDPDFVVVEDPPAKYELPAQTALRAVLAKYPEQFAAAAEFPVESQNLEWLEGRRLLIYKNLKRDPTRPREVRMRMLWQGGEVRAGVK